MANNEPGNGRDPWKRDDDQPNDLDQIARYWQKRFEGILGGGGSGGRGGSGGAGGQAHAGIQYAAGHYAGPALALAVSDRDSRYRQYRGSERLQFFQGNVDGG